MTLLSIIFKFQCDDCGKIVELIEEADYKPPKDWCMMDIAEDSFRGSGGIVSDNSEHYCIDCAIKRPCPKCNDTGVNHGVQCTPTKRHPYGWKSEKCDCGA